MAEDQKSYHFDEVSKHNATKDCWLIIHGKYFFHGPFISSKTGEKAVLQASRRCLLAATGKDATNDFEDVGHSDSARDMIHKYCIGEIDASTVPAKRAYVPPQQAPYNPDKTSDFVIKILQFLVPILILGLAFAVRYYTKAE
ncbi:cytochrome b5-like [Dendrobium catenatum]|uniref:cytochrome b5-like n=1 Tax=Dendrobium catenatum TaxID=906689 RepID=UPI00109FDFCE|nr:cytochrome b5-like [Dendrobium catenatum]